MENEFISYRHIDNDLNCRCNDCNFVRTACMREKGLHKVPEWMTDLKRDGACLVHGSGILKVGDGRLVRTDSVEPHNTLPDLDTYPMKVVSRERWCAWLNRLGLHAVVMIEHSGQMTRYAHTPTTLELHAILYRKYGHIYMIPAEAE